MVNVIINRSSLLVNFHVAPDRVLLIDLFQLINNFLSFFQNIHFPRLRGRFCRPFDTPRDVHCYRLMSMIRNWTLFSLDRHDRDS